MQIQDIGEGNTLTHKEETEIRKIIIKKSPSLKKDLILHYKRLVPDKIIFPPKSTHRHILVKFQRKYCDI